jgi:hypothetical protein
MTTWFAVPVELIIPRLLKRNENSVLFQDKFCGRAGDFIGRSQPHLVEKGTQSHGVIHVNQGHKVGFS